MKKIYPQVITDMYQLGISPALFKAMVDTVEINRKQIKINKKAIRKELKARQRKNVGKGLR